MPRSRGVSKLVSNRKAVTKVQLDVLLLERADDFQLSPSRLDIAHLSLQGCLAPLVSALYCLPHLQLQMDQDNISAFDNAEFSVDWSALYCFPQESKTPYHRAEKCRVSVEWRGLPHMRNGHHSGGKTMPQP